MNPRQNDTYSNYTKYSFPSKIMEYMTSGVPVLTYKLEGIPDEYDEYLYYVRGDTEDDLKNAIEDICNKNKQELLEFGNRAREWVLKEKNCVVQCAKIINMLKGN